MKKHRYIISGGGTGGHIYPAVAIAEELKKRFPEAEFLFIGAKGKMEMEKIPQLGYNIKGLWISGIQRKFDLKNFLFPFKLIFSLLQSVAIMIKFQPSMAIGTGGFASAAALKAASWLSIPTLIQEQNSYAGITNKWLAPGAKSICVAYENMDAYFPEAKIKLTGNPIRLNLLNQKLSSEEAKQKLGLSTGQQAVFVVGGSLGSQRINELIAEKLNWFQSHHIQVIWQTGQLYYERYKDLENDSVKVLKYIEDMNLTYAASDVIISRAGAGSVSELAIVGKPVLFIPSPNVAENHQVKNAEAIVDKDAALMLEEHNLDKEFDDIMHKLTSDIELQENLSHNFKKLAKPNATKEIVDEIERIEKPRS
ncbi:undecaprenyldiphospho-muramoylpentapeptide beta-N-acetylglucosaminyltransferase [Psychroflexus halocasei]|uniref:UDP-N-acetylglucosamine--N-acetylmuramyl-(pentapeptide) pyrophosphoryl-undecaprenol N-acetylglucosamine transferase n=1 Tax=Psychroflexus halocasei TaxID=908615 RepID=A0A1H3XHI6_9FLAO|nr:undecaprenyldiphospho-muramoylpentapeptide beta-N-acetylglucosaminyltransferase [Psychroflexus halocasei]SDZ98783.1 UDP-N-acetylglucosamine--N-acetylmuramyl-(pentapeptide) pyrophosphoryl-undecaprenol N-acetylglucosamine transferase [Psychroflexus halocasei]